MPDYDYKKLDNVLHSRIRLAIVSVMIGAGEIEFTALRDAVGATDGNMNTHLKRLEEEDYISVEKKFINRKPTTIYRLTKKGIGNFEEYIKELEKFIKKN